MSGPFDILHIGLSGTKAANAGVSTTGQNIANAETPGFHRREVVLATADPVREGGLYLGRGVDVAGTRRMVDEMLGRRVLTAQADARSAGRRSEILGQAEAVFGDVEGQGISPALDELFAAFDLLGAMPQDLQARENALQAAEGVAAQVRGRALEVRQIRESLDSSLETGTASVNTLVDQIADLNKKIVENPGAQDDLFDQRDKALAELGQYVGFRVTGHDDGTVTLSNSDGFTFVQQNVAHHLSVQRGTDGLGHVYGTDGSGQRDLTARIDGGAIGGTLKARDVDLKATTDGLDAFAFGFANAVNAVHAAGFGLDSVNGRNLFAPPAAQAGAAEALAVDAALIGRSDRLAAALDPALLPGDNRNAMALAALRDSAVVNGQAPSASIRSVLTRLGTSVHEAQIASTAMDATAQKLTDLEQSVSGVSLDEEMVALIRFRESYQAASQVIKTADEMLGELLALKQ